MYWFSKILFDYLFATILLFFLSPIFVICSIIFFIDLKENIFFLQKRQGYKGKVFRIIKFKTMNNSLDKNGNLKSDIERLTTTGAFARKYSIDELPGLFNILLGQMSFVGPRPILAEYDKSYSAEQRKRFLVKPGITGWAQVNGRNAISWEEKFKLDIWYIENRSFILDFKILLRTIFKVFDNKDINSNENDTMSKFEGNEKLYE